jgi:hypothetical protein
MIRLTQMYFAILALAVASCVAAQDVSLVDLDSDKAPFESGDKAELVTEHATAGKKALKLGAGGGVRFNPATGMKSDWSKFDVVKLELFNAGEKPVKIYMQVRDKDNSSNYWSWHNRYAAVAPGQNSIQFAVADTWRGEVLRRDAGGMLDTKDIQLFYLSAMDGDVFVSGIHLANFPAQKVDVPGLKAFDVEIENAPGFPGYVSLTPKDLYNKQKGYGWTKTQFYNENNRDICIRLHPDNLFRDWIACANAELAVDVPNGKYRVRMQLEDPGAWEFMQNYRKRTVTAEGKVVLDETMDSAEFMNRFFRNQDSEDLPSDDPFEKYVETRHPWKEFDVEVADGQLNLGFQSADTYGLTLSALVISPLEQEEKAKQFMVFTKEMRKFDWSQSWKAVSKPPTTPNFSGKAAEEATANGYVLFTNTPKDSLDYNHVPQDPELLKGVSASAALGQFENVTFGLRPARQIGKVDVSISALKNTAGDEIPAGNIATRVGRYRFCRHDGEQSGLYDVNEKQLCYFNRTDTDQLRCNDGMARRFWITVHVPENAKPGSYSAQVTISAEKGARHTIPLTLEVLPITLPDPDHLFAVYGVGTLPMPYYEEIRQDIPRRLGIVYADAREHGINYLLECAATPQLENGKAVISNAAEVERDLALRRKLGFKDGPVGVNGGCGLGQLANDATIQGMPKAKFIEAWHKTITDTFKQKGWPHPYFCYGDEPNLPQVLKQLTAANNACHAVSPEIWMGVAYHIDARVKESSELAETLDVHHLKEFCPPSDFEFAKKSAKFILHCNVGMGRLPYGLREWRATQEKKTDGCVTYAYMGSHVDIYYGLDAREDDYLLAPPRKDGSLTTTSNWENMRAGIDDYRYARALEKFASNSSAAKDLLDSAKALLKQAFDIGGMKDHSAAQKLAVQWRADAQALLTRAAKP